MFAFLSFEVAEEEEGMRFADWLGVQTEALKGAQES
jgi:hypothetical protein